MCVHCRPPQAKLFCVMSTSGPDGIDQEMHAHLENVVDGLVNATGGSMHRHELRELVHDSYSRLAENATVTTFLPALTRRYALIRLRSRDIQSGATAKEKREILIVDRANAARSQTATALIRFYAPGRYNVESAGVDPKGTIDPRVVGLLRERGVELTDFPKHLTPELLATADDIIRINHKPLDLPDLHDREIAHWDIEDPSGMDHHELEQLLSQIDAHVRDLLYSIEPDHQLVAPVFG